MTRSPLSLACLRKLQRARAIVGQTPLPFIATVLAVATLFQVTLGLVRAPADVEPVEPAASTATTPSPRGGPERPARTVNAAASATSEVRRSRDAVLGAPPRTYGRR